MIQTKALRLCVALLLLSLTIGCNDETPTGPILGDFVYPVQVGQVWQYSGSFYSFNMMPESLSVCCFDSISSASTVEVTHGTRLGDTLSVYCFQETLVQEDMRTYQSWYYFNNRSDGLYCYAHGGTSARMQPRKALPSRNQLVFHGKPLDEIKRLMGSPLFSLSSQMTETDSITTIEDPPVQSLRYPLTAGSEWLVKAVPEVLSIKKGVIDRVQIRVPAGFFTCARIQWLYDLGSDGSWDADIEVYDYVSQIGLVKRAAIYHNVDVVTFEYPLGIGTCDYADVWELTQTQSGQ